MTLSSTLADIEKKLQSQPQLWVVTGCAGFIGSHILESLLRAEQKVIGIDSLITGHEHNLDQVRQIVGETCWKNFQWIKGDINELPLHEIFHGAKAIFHQAALGSVPRSIEHPLATNQHNIEGTLKVLRGAHESKTYRVIYASSSSVYGDSEGLPKVEDHIGKPLSPYAVSKRTNALYAQTFSLTYDLETIGLRYFNVFGPRQDPKGPYAAVIPRWISKVANGSQVQIYGDGSTSRDFCYVKNVVKANLLAATAELSRGSHHILNVGAGDTTSLNTLFERMKLIFSEWNSKLVHSEKEHLDFRPGDIKHSLADISLAKKILGYSPDYNVSDGLKETIHYFLTKPVEAQSHKNTNTPL